jgi:hypothetical protein
MRKIFAGLIAATLMLSACSSDDDVDGRTGLLAYVPSDSPYVFASTRPLPDDVADKFEPVIDELLRAYRDVLQFALKEHLATVSAEGGSDDEVAQIEAVAEEVFALMSIEGIRGAGIGRDSLFAIYGNGLLPVIRFELTDAALFDAAIARIESKAAKTLATDEVDGKEYRYFEVDKLKIVIATLGEHAVVTLVPAAFDAPQMALALGVSAPKENMADGGTLAKIQDQYDFAGYMTGYIDFQRLSETISGDAGGLNADLFAAMAYEPPDLSATCRTELAALVEIAPRMVVGYSDFNEDFIDSSMIIEMRSDIAAGLALLPTAVPGLGIDSGDFFSMGFSIDLRKARDFLEARVTAIEDDPYECEIFANLNQSATQGRAMLDQQVPPVAYSFRGFLARLSNLDGFDLAGGKPPESVDATLTLAIDDAATLISMGSMFVPELATLNLSADGKAVQLDMPQLNAVAEQAYAAMLDDLLVVSLGDGAEKNVGEALQAASGKPPPFMSMTMDAARYYAMMGEVMMKEQPGDGDNEMSSEMRKSLSDVMRLSGSIYERMAVDVHLTARGVEIDAHMTLAD